MVYISVKVLSNGIKLFHLLEDLATEDLSLLLTDDDRQRRLLLVSESLVPAATGRGRF